MKQTHRENERKEPLAVRVAAFAEQRSHYIFSKRREQLNQGGSRAESARTPLVLRFVLFYLSFYSLCAPFLLPFLRQYVRSLEQRGSWDSLSNLITATFNWICDRHESTFASFSFVLIGVCPSRLLTCEIERTGPLDFSRRSFMSLRSSLEDGWTNRWWTHGRITLG